MRQSLLHNPNDGDKPASRFKGEIVDREGNVIWEVLAHEYPGLRVQLALRKAGLKFCRASTPRSGPLPMNYSEDDPEESIEAAYEHYDRRDTQTAKVLMLLLAYAKDPDPWVSRKDIRRVGGDSGDRRVRDLRAMNWPVEISQLKPGEAWHVRLNLNGIKPRILRGAKLRNPYGPNTR
jgi:hypothetical protein